MHSCVLCACVFLWLFVKCHISFSATLVFPLPPPRRRLVVVFFIFFDDNVWFACEKKTYFPTKKIKEKCTLSRDSGLSFFRAVRQQEEEKKRKHEKIESFPLLMCWVLSCSGCQNEIRVWFWSVEDGGGSPQPHQENYSDAGWCCVTGRSNAGGRGDVSLRLSSAASSSVSLWQLAGWQLNFSLSWESIWVCEALNCTRASQAQRCCPFPPTFFFLFNWTEISAASLENWILRNWFTARVWDLKVPNYAKRHFTNV